MTHLLCPLCGGSKPLSTFDPASLELDITMRKYTGLGRGRGFRLDSTQSVLHNTNITQPIADRILALLGLFIREGIVSETEVYESLELHANSELDSKKIRNLISKVSSALDEPPSYWSSEEDDSDPLAILTAGLDRLVSEYLAMNAVN